MEKNQSESIIPTIALPLPPPPPPFLTLNLPPPTITQHAYTLHYQKKHIAMINGETQFLSLKQEVDVKLKSKLQKNDKNAQQSESTGQKQLRNMQICQKCIECGHWVEKDEIKLHMTFHANKIINNLLLGDKHSSKSKKQLFQRNKVTHIVNAAAELANHFENQGIKYLKLDLMDQHGQEVIPEATRAAEFINQSINEGGCVFVHCAVGKSRSVSAIIMYLMNYVKMTYSQSLELIRQARPIAKPNVSYEQQLKQYSKLHIQKQL